MFKFAKFRGHDSLVRRPSSQFDELISSSASDIGSVGATLEARYVYNGGLGRRTERFDVKFVGLIRGVSLLKPSLCQRDEELQLADILQEKQLLGELKLDASDLSTGILSISNTDIKITLSPAYTHHIAWCDLVSSFIYTNYDGSAMLVLSAMRAQPMSQWQSLNVSDQSVDCHLVQCRSLEQAHVIAQTLRSTLESICADPKLDHCETQSTNL